MKTKVKSDLSKEAQPARGAQSSLRKEVNRRKILLLYVDFLLTSRLLGRILFFSMELHTLMQIISCISFLSACLLGAFFFQF